MNITADMSHTAVCQKFDKKKTSAVFFEKLHTI